MLKSFLKFTQLESDRAGIQVEDSGRRATRAKASVTGLVSQETEGQCGMSRVQDPRESSRCPDNKISTEFHIYLFFYI